MQVTCPPARGRERQANGPVDLCSEQPLGRRGSPELNPLCFFISLLQLCLFQLLENIAEIDLFRDYRMEILDLHTLLLHCVAVTDGHAAVIE